MSNLLLSIIGIVLFTFAVISTLILINTIRKKQNKIKERILEVIISLFSIGFAFLSLFVPQSNIYYSFNSLESHVDTMNNEVINIKSEVDAINVDIASISSEINGVKTEIDTFNSVINNMHETINSVNARLSEQNNVYGTNNYYENYFAGTLAEGKTIPTLAEEDDFYFVNMDSFLTGWNDSNNGRPQLTIESVNNGVIDSKIVFNSIIDNPDMNEFFFVSARENNPDYFEEERLWHTHLEAKKNKSYIVRLFVHNNSRFGMDAIAENVRVRFNIGVPVHVANDEVHDVEGFNSEDGYWAVGVYGFIYADNADPKEYYYAIKFVSNRRFHLEYIPGSAIYENKGIGNGGISLSDKIMTDEGVIIGYDALDGRIPGCFEYSSFSTIKVYPVFE